MIASRWNLGLDRAGLPTITSPVDLASASAAN